ncbi:hypothetical protein EJB05_24378, partial [Eragrostis curvula]
MQPTNGVAATAACTSTDADGAGSSKKGSDAAGGGRVVDLPLHITEKILCHMSLMESARLATVCKSWAATVAALRATPAPHLYVCMPPDNTSDRRGLVASVVLEDGALAGGGAPATIPARVHSSETNGMRCIGATPSGRVAFGAGCFSDNVVLVNPITGAQQSIHVGKSRTGMDPRYNQVLAAGAGGVDSLFAVDGYQLMLWRQAPGDGEEWSTCAVAATWEHLRSPILSAVNCNGCYYLLHVDGSLSMVDATAPPPLRMEKLPVARLVVPLGDHYVSGHLIESEGEVLFVKPLVTCKEGDSLSVGYFEVHRLDLKKNCWAKVNELPGDRALFVSAGSSFAVRVSDTPGCKRNCIYFVGEKRYYLNPACHEGRGSSWGVYSMEDRRVLFEHAVTGPGSFTETWFLPRLVQCGLYK